MKSLHFCRACGATTSLAALSALLLSYGCALAAQRSVSPAAKPIAQIAAPAAASSGPVPAFLDAANEVTLWMDQPVTAASLMNHVSVRCGAELISVSRVVEVPTVDKSTEVVLAGTLQSALGDSDWSTDDARTRMTEVSPGVYELQVRLPKGSYQYKVARGGGWSDNYGVGMKQGGDNIPLVVPADGPVLFKVDFNRHTLQTSLDTPGLSANAAPIAASTTVAAHLLRLILARPLGPGDIARPLSVHFSDQASRPIYAREVLSSSQYFYSGGDLGATYTRASTTFKVWSPVSSSAQVLLYKTARANVNQRVPMHLGPSGVWSATAPGDLNGVYYQYRFNSYGATRVAPDIYGRAASSDLQRTMVVDLPRTDPSGWSDTILPHLGAPTDAVVYEAHIRDFTIDPASGVPENLRGKYLGVVAPGTTVPGTQTPTGLDYLQQLGITDLHLLPFQSIAQHRTPGYNWGYETFLFDVPEPRYAQTPDNPASVITDVKTMIVGLHRAHIGLVMDVVYNHTMPASGDASPFWATVPYYYFRTAPNGDLLDESGVGNAVDDDHPMVRKYICDSVGYWESQYHVDGFRFDLMGMFEPATVAAISQTLHRLRPDVLIYGEPWTGGGPTRFGKGKQKGLGVAVFNDNIRNTVRGDLDGAKPGFALGGDTDAATLATEISGSPDFTQAPSESMNYVSIHDDRTLWDKITQTLPGNDALDRQALKLAGAVVLLSQGVPILEGGAEMGRTKQGNSNSYNAGDAINRFDWSRGQQFADVSSYYAGLIAVRRAHPVFREATAAGVKQTLMFLLTGDLPQKTIAFTLDGAASDDSWRKTLVIFHGSTDAATATLPPGQWRLAVDGSKAQTEGSVVPGSTLPLAPLSAYVLYQQ